MTTLATRFQDRLNVARKIDLSESAPRADGIAQPIMKDFNTSPAIPVSLKPSYTLSNSCWIPGTLLPQFAGHAQPDFRNETLCRAGNSPRWAAYRKAKKGCAVYHPLLPRCGRDHLSLNPVLLCQTTRSASNSRGFAKSCMAN